VGRGAEKTMESTATTVVCPFLHETDPLDPTGWFKGLSEASTAVEQSPRNGSSVSHKRPRTGSVSQRLRQASDLEEKGLIDRWKWPS
jgi:hypothetical protein